MIHLINRPELVGNTGYSGVGSVVERESERSVAFVCRDRTGAVLAANVTVDGLHLFVQMDGKVESVIHVPGDMVLDFTSWVLRSHLKAARYESVGESLDELEKRLGFRVGAAS